MIGEGDKTPGFQLLPHGSWFGLYGVTQLALMAVDEVSGLVVGGREGLRNGRFSLSWFGVQK